MIQDYIKKQVTSCNLLHDPNFKTNVTQTHQKVKKVFSLDSENTGLFLFSFFHIFVISKFSTIELVNYFKDEFA